MQTTLIKTQIKHTIITETGFTLETDDFFSNTETDDYPYLIIVAVMYSFSVPFL